MHHNRLQLCLTDQTTFPQRTQDIISLLVAGKQAEELMSQMKLITLMQMSLHSWVAAVLCVAFKSQDVVTGIKFDFLQEEKK